MRTYIQLLAMLLIAFNVQATDYYSTADGNWSDPIWSTSSHSDLTNLRALDCQIQGNDNIYIAHNIVNNCVTLELGRAGGGSFVNIFNTGTLILNGDLELHGNSEINVSGYFLINGDVRMTGTSYVCGTGTAIYTGTLTTTGTSSWCSALPIELATFSAEWGNNGARLYWATESESNNDFFNVERCIDGRNFEIIAEIDAAGNSSEHIGYEYLDETSLKNYDWVYYRLKQTDFDGKFSYSNVVALQVEKTKTDESVLIFPNPAKDNFSVVLNGVINEAEVAVYDMLGQLIIKELVYGDRQTLTFDSNNWEAGTYIIVINNGDKHLKQRVLIAK